MIWRKLRLQKKYRFFLNELDNKFATVTARYRVSPQFLVIGAMKAGTTSLYHYISQHPQVLPSRKKEIHYFDGGQNPETDNYLKNYSWYKSHFPLKISLKPGMITGEASPRYLYDPRAPGRIAKVNHNMRLIVILRNPTERAISHYFHEKRQLREESSMLEALQNEESRMKQVMVEKEYNSSIFAHCSYKDRGLYGKQIKRYLEYFNREQLLILESQDFFTRPEENMRKVFQFLGVDSTYIPPHLEIKNKSANKTEVDPQVYLMLDRFFHQHNLELFQLIGKRFDW